MPFIGETVQRDASAVVPAYLEHEEGNDADRSMVLSNRGAAMVPWNHGVASTSVASIPTSVTPHDRRIYRILIICALIEEIEMVCAVLDEDLNKGRRPWEREENGDRFDYIYGKLAGHYVVILYLPSIGNISTALAAAHVKEYFRSIEFAFVVGICGVAPVHPETGESIFLGDCVVSTGIFNYGHGRHHPNGIVSYESHRIGVTPPERLGSRFGLMRVKREELRSRMTEHLKTLQSKSDDPVSVRYPGLERDRLHPSDYIHKHQNTDTRCDDCIPLAGVCSKSCQDLGCDDGEVDERRRPAFQQSSSTHDYIPQIHFGSFGSTEFVMRSGLHRDGFVRKLDLAAFEMEGAGVAKTFTTIIVKAGSDYADSHKNKEWRRFPAAVAAATVKAVLEWFKPADFSATGQEQTLRNLTHRVHHHNAIMIMPFKEDERFVGREHTLRQLENTFVATGYSPAHRRAALVGLPGVGKSQIAIAFAYKLREKSPQRHIFWINASDRLKFEQSYKAIAHRANLSIPEGSDVLTIVYHWLSDPANGDWTLILDEADDMNTFTTTSETGQYLLDIVPQVPHGSVLITTNNKEAGMILSHDSACLKIDPMNEEDSLKLLLRNATFKEQDIPLAKQLVKELDYLPLGIVQAAGQIGSRKLSVTIKKFLAMIKRNSYRTELFRTQAGVDHRRPLSSQKGVFEIMQSLFDNIRTQNEHAVHLFSLISMFNNEDIPRTLLYGQIGSIGKSFDDRIALLENFSLIGSDVESASYKVHKLTQSAMVHWLEQKGTSEVYQKLAFQAIDTVFPKQPQYENWPTCQHLIAHAKRVMEYDLGDHLELRLGLMERIAQYLYATGHIRGAEATCEKAWSLAGRMYRYPAILRIKNLQAIILHSKGQYLEANESLSQVVRAYENLPYEHTQSQNSNYLALDLLSAKSTQASNLRQLHRCEEAEALERHVLTSKSEWLGLHHRATLESKAKLVLTIASQCKWSEARSLCKEVLKEKERHLPPNDPDTLASMADLAMILRRERKYPDAKKWYEDTLRLEKKALGDRHPRTLITMANLAITLFEIEEHDQAEKLIRYVLEVRKRSLSKDDPRTLASKHDLGRALFEQKKYEEARETFESALDGRIRVLGYSNSQTKKSMQALCNVLESLQQYDAAKRLRTDFGCELVPTNIRPRSVGSTARYSLSQYSLSQSSISSRSISDRTVFDDSASTLSMQTVREEQIVEPEIAPVFQYARVLHDFKDKRQGLLNFRKDDRIQVIRMEATGWWYGILDTDRGWFPAAFVSLVSTVIIDPDHEDGHCEAEARRAVSAWFDHLQVFARHLTGEQAINRSVKMAILNTGYDRPNGVTRYRDFVHGKHTMCKASPYGIALVDQLMKTFPAAQLHVARVAPDAQMYEVNPDIIAKAIDWAIQELQVDIVCICVGYTKLSKALITSIENAPQDVLVFTAATRLTNDLQENVFAICSIDVRGVASVSNPEIWQGQPNFAILGDGVRLTEADPLGSSMFVATSLAAGVASQIIAFWQSHIEPYSDRRMIRRDMAAVLRMMADQSGLLQCIIPWAILPDTPDQKQAEEVRFSLASKINEALHTWQSEIDTGSIAGYPERLYSDEQRSSRSNLMAIDQESIRSEGSSRYYTARNSYASPTPGHQSRTSIASSTTWHTASAGHNLTNQRGSSISSAMSIRSVSSAASNVSSAARSSISQRSAPGSSSMSIRSVSSVASNASIAAWDPLLQRGSRNSSSLSLQDGREGFSILEPLEEVEISPEVQPPRSTSRGSSLSYQTLDAFEAEYYQSDDSDSTSVASVSTLGPSRTPPQHATNLARAPTPPTPLEYTGAGIHTLHHMYSGDDYIYCRKITEPGFEYELRIYDAGLGYLLKATTEEQNTRFIIWLAFVDHDRPSRDWFHRVNTRLIHLKNIVVSVWSTLHASRTCHNRDILLWTADYCAANEIQIALVGPNDAPYLNSYRSGSYESDD